MTREEAINLVKQVLPCLNIDEKIREGFETLIPELRESEDEKIRNEILTFIKHFWADYKESLPHIISWIVYLEKQKDVSKAVEAVKRIDKYIDEHLANAHDMKDSNPDKKYYCGLDDALGKIAGILQDVYSDEKQKEQNSEDEECISHLPVQSKGIYKICPHCKERMKGMIVRSILLCLLNTDTIVLNAVLWNLTSLYDNPETEEQKPRKFKLGDKVHCYWDDYNTNVITITGFRDDAYLTDSAYGPILFKDEDNWEKIEQKPTEINLKALLTADRLASAEMTGRLKERSEILENPEKYGLQKQIEWDEEDEVMLKEIVSFFKDDSVKLQHDLDLYAAFLEKRLKSLRNHPKASDTWRPSKEQMKALFHAVNKARTLYFTSIDGCPGYNDLRSLYAQLKNLM